MAEDWKDILKALNPGLADNPEIIDYAEETPESNKKEALQTTPLTIIRDTKGRKGKVAVIIEGFTIPNAEIEDIAKQLKNKLGCGGSVRDGEILIQGDKLKEVREKLLEMGFKIKG